MREWVGLSVATALVALALVAAPVAAPAASAAPADVIYSLVNQARAQAGLRGFLRNAGMDAVAVKWAKQLAAQGTLAHNPHFTTQIPAGWSRAAENVAQGYPTPQAMFSGWMRSTGHRANILGNYTDIGIAFISVNGVTWGVQDIGAYRGHVGPAAPRPPAPRTKPAPRPSSTPSVTLPAETPVPSASASPSVARSDLAMLDRQHASAPITAGDVTKVTAAWITAFIGISGAGTAVLVLLIRRRSRHRSDQ